jgi:hypothetical protein
MRLLAHLLLQLSVMALLSSCRDQQLETLQAQKTAAEAKMGFQEVELKQVKAELEAINLSGLETTIRNLQEQLAQAQQALREAEAKPKLPQLLGEKELAANWRTQFDATQYSSLFPATPSASVGGIQAPDFDRLFSRDVTLTLGTKTVKFTATADATGKWRIPAAENIAKSMAPGNAVGAIKISDTGANSMPSPPNTPRSIGGTDPSGVFVTPSPQRPLMPTQKDTDPDDSSGHGKRGGREGISPPKPSPQR